MSRIVEKIAEEARQEGLIEGEIEGEIVGRIVGEIVGRIVGEIVGKTDFLRELIQRLNNFGASVPEMVRISGHTEEEVLAVLAEIGDKSMSKIEILQHTTFKESEECLMSRIVERIAEEALQVVLEEGDFRYADIGRPDIEKIKTLAAVYEVQTYLANKIAELQTAGILKDDEGADLDIK